MARIRTIKPGFFKSEDVSVLPLRARLTWIGLWTHCDDAGRTKDNTRLIKGDVWPLDDVSLRDIEEDLETLAAHGRIVRYEVGGQRYLEVTNWSEHQVINRPTPSRLPPPPTHSLNGQGAVREPSLSPHTGKGKEGKGKEGTRARDAPTKPSAKEADEQPSPEPPTKCPKHANDPDPPPCGPCANARRAHDRWEADRNTRYQYAPKCRKHQGKLAHNCPLCRSERIAGAA
jgi:hypothetical protein